MEQSQEQAQWSSDTITSLRFPVVSPAVATHTAVWNKKVGQVSFSVFSKPYTFKWIAPTIAGKFPVQGEVFCISVQSGTDEFEILLPYTLISVWLMSYLDQVDFTSFDPAYRLILLEVAFADLLSKFEEKMGHPLVLSLSGESHQKSFDITETFVCISPEDVSFALKVRCSKASHEKLMSFLSDITHIEKKCHANLRFRVLAGFTYLESNDLFNLDQGSIIQLTTQTNPLETPKGLLEDRFICDLSAVSGQASVTLQSALSPYDYRRKGVGMDAQSSESVLHSTLEGLKVPVYFELNHLDVPVESLSHLQAGHVFNMNKPISEGVDLIVNGRIIGKGEIVQVGQNFGVLVSEVY